MNIDYLVKHQIIKEKEKTIYEYGKHQMLTFLLNILTAIFIGILMSKVKESIVFSISYIMLRSNAGGYHANTATKCYVYSSMLIILALMGVTYLSSIKISIGVLVISSIVIYFLAPVEAKNKPLDNIEETVYRRRTLIILGVEATLAILLLFLNIKILSASIIIAIGSVSVMLILGKYLT